MPPSVRPVQQQITESPYRFPALVTAIRHKQNLLWNDRAIFVNIVLCQSIYERFVFIAKKKKKKKKKKILLLVLGGRQAFSDMHIKKEGIRIS